MRTQKTEDRRQSRKKVITLVVMAIAIVFIQKNLTANNSCSAGDMECMEKMHEHMQGEMGHSEHMKGMHQHKEFQKAKNPVEKTPKSLYEGRILYEKNCASCHGKRGNGDTPAGKALKPPAADFTDNVWKHGATDGEIFHVISEGVPGTGMTAWKNTLTEEERWKLVNFIKCFQEMDKAVYQCPMHPEVKSNLPDRCTKCGMYLEKQNEKKEEHKEHKH